IHLSKDQENAISSILHWFRNVKSKRFVLAGYAGTGKTVLISEIMKILSKDYIIKVCAPTGKAASVLRHKGVPATTLHKLIYNPETFCLRCSETIDPVKGLDKKAYCPKCKTGNLKTKWTRVPCIEADLVIIDESSMLNKMMVDDAELL